MEATTDFVEVTPALAFDIGDLTADHTTRVPEARATICDGIQDTLGRDMQAAFGDKVEGKCEKSVTRQDCHRFTVNDMGGRTAAPQVIVINRGQVIVDE